MTAPRRIVLPRGGNAGDIAAIDDGGRRRMRALRATPERNR
ncbi:MAG: hypothetical protein V4472_05150 [Pseudomonadota bacterium]